MTRFLVEIPLIDAGGRELARASQTLEAAQSRLRRYATATHVIITGITRAGGRLICVIEAPSHDTVRQLIRLALLPAGRIREIAEVGDAS